MNWLYRIWQLVLTLRLLGALRGNKPWDKKKKHWLATPEAPEHHGGTRHMTRRLELTRRRMRKASQSGQHPSYRSQP